jgi:hypothetical protein
LSGHATIFSFFHTGDGLDMYSPPLSRENFVPSEKIKGFENQPPLLCKTPNPLADEGKRPSMLLCLFEYVVCIDSKHTEVVQDIVNTTNLAQDICFDGNFMSSFFIQNILRNSTLTIITSCRIGQSHDQ